MSDQLDYWRAIEEELPGALRLAQRLLRDTQRLRPLMEARYRAGAEEFQGDWLSRPRDWFGVMADEEAADLVVYLAMRAVRFRRGTP